MSFQITSSRQLIVVLSNSWIDLKARIFRFEMHGSEWVRLPGHFEAVVGGSGMAWGIGLHEKHGEGPVKKEGDRKAPAGIFRLVKAMGYDSAPPARVSFPYKQILEKSLCIDDPDSKFYNQILNETEIPLPGIPWKSSELMRRKDALYKWLIVVDYNVVEPKPGAGSCIFIHVWKSGTEGTAGCTAMAEKDLLELLAWLKSDANPTLVQLPKDVYDEYREPWDLPARE
jgi:zinc D-Ala-D-Ala dipeptidase